MDLYNPGYAPSTLGIGNVKSKTKQRAISIGKVLAPRFTEMMTRKESKELEAWGPRFAYMVIIAYVLMDLMQFVYIFSENKKLLVAVSTIRLLMLIGVFLTTGYSVIKGWRSVTINIWFQIVMLVLTILITIAAAISMVVKLHKRKEKSVMDYVRVLFPFIQMIMAIWGLISLIRVYLGPNASKGYVGMVGITVMVLFSILAGLFSMWNMIQTPEADFIHDEK
jgi:hypothetical protein